MHAPGCVSVKSSMCFYVDILCVCLRVYPSVFDLERAAAGVDVSSIQSQFGLLCVLH